jgi:hypothetical protein
MMQRSMDACLGEIEAAFTGSKVPLPLSLKVKTAEVLLALMGRKRPFGMFVILGWKRVWQGYLDISDNEQDIYAKSHVDITDVPEGAVDAGLASTRDFDGAILIDRRGQIVHSGVIIEGLRPRVVAAKVNPGRFKDLSEQFGFTEKVHARHLSAITASYVFKGTTVFTVSEENGKFHVFEGGRIVYSS